MHYLIIRIFSAYGAQNLSTVIHLSGFEPETSGLQDQSSTIELQARTSYYEINLF